jgi:hypothetical protein
MAYTTKYQTIFEDINGNRIKVLFQSEAAGSAITIDGTSLIYRDSDGDFDKLAGVKPSSLEIGLLFNKDFDPSTLTPSFDTEWKVLLYINDVLNWSGWLDAAAPAWPLLDSNYTLTLTARDGLHLLKSAEFLDLSDNKIWAFKRISDIITFCLDKTDLGLNWRNWVNIFPTGASIRNAGADPTGTRDPFYITYLNSGTFLNGVTQFETPLDILEKICLSFGLRLFQRASEWQVVYVEDWIKNGGLSCTLFNASGVPQSISLDQRHRLNFGLNQSKYLINEDAQISVQKAYKYVKTSFLYDIPTLLRNEDLSSGDFINFISPATIARYNLDAWTQEAGWDFYTDAQLVVSSDATTEKLRYIQCEADGTNSTGQITSTSIPVQAGDMFTFSFNLAAGDNQVTNKWRCFIDTKLTSSSPIADKWLGRDGKWKTTRQYYELATALNGTLFTLEVPYRYNYATVDPIPTGGQSIEIILRFEEAKTGVISSGEKGIRIWDMKFDYTPSLSNYASTSTGQEYKNEGTNKKNETVDLQVYVSDSPNVTLKGSLINGASAVQNYWFHAGVSESVRLGTLLNRAKWKAYWRNFYRVEGTLKNIIDSNILISPLNTLIYVGYDGDYLNSREYAICTLREVDILRGTAEGTFVELLNTSNTDDFDQVGTETFKLINFREVINTPEEELKSLPPKDFGAIGWAFWKLFGKGKKKK